MAHFPFQTLRIRIFVLISFLLIISPGCSSHGSHGPRRYKAAGFSVQIPEGWNARLEWGVFGNILSAADPATKASVNFTRIEITKQNSMEDVMEATLKQLGMSLEAKGSTTIVWHKTLWFKASRSNQIVLEYMILKENQVFTITAMTFSENYERYEKTFKEIVDSFRWER